jgi:flagellar protein FlbD
VTVEVPVITVTRLDGSHLTINADLLEYVEATPDTILTMTTGHKLVVRETPESITQAVVAYRQRILRGPTVSMLGAAVDAAAE